MIRELAHRSSDGIDVSLLWDSETNRVLIAVEENEYGASLQFDVAGDDALDAFHHPYAYAARDHHEDALAA